MQAKLRAVQEAMWRAGPALKLFPGGYVAQLLQPGGSALSPSMFVVRNHDACMMHDNHVIFP